MTAPSGWTGYPSPCLGLGAPGSRMEQQQREQGIQEATHCYWHPDVETGLYCGRCEKHICTQCMIQAPVGIRCRDCGKATRMPTYDVRPTYYARAVSVGVAGAVGGGVLWALFNWMLGGIPFLPSLAALGVGYAVGELISLSVNRKRGKGLAWIAGGSVAGAFVISWLILPFIFSIFGLLLIGLGVYSAVQRVR